MADIMGIFSVNGIPRNGATARLWAAGNFATRPVKNDAVPTGTAVASATTGPSHGCDGGYRFQSVSVGEYYVSVAWNGTTTYEYYSIVDNPVVSVLDYGADETGTLDSHDIIQNAINALSVSGGTLYFPAGTYLVSPSGTAKHIELKSNVHLLGDGPQSIIKVKSGVGNYEKVFSATGSSLVNVTVSKLRFDQNVSGNSGTVVHQSVAGARAYMFQIGVSANNIHFRDCNFDQTCAVNTITINSVSSYNCSVERCFFNWKQATTSGGVDYDNSAVYMQCRLHQVIGCRFQADVSGSAFGAIETHNGASSIMGNTSIGFHTGVNVVSSPGDKDGRQYNDIVVSNNSFNKCNHGIVLWGRSAPSACTLQNVVVDGNILDVAQVSHDQPDHSGIKFYYAVGTDWTADIEDVSITNNVITFETEPTSGRTYTTSNSAGISLRSKGNNKNIVVSNNVVRNAPVRGIQIGNNLETNTVRAARIDSNIVIDCGHDTNASITQRAAIQAESNLTDVIIQDNLIVDNGTNLNGYQSIEMTAGTFVRCVVKDNLIRYTQGGLRYNVNYYGAGKEVDVGQNTELQAFVTSFPPATGSFLAGDANDGRGHYVYEHAAANIRGTERVWKFYQSGTFGTLTGVSGITVSGSSFVTIVPTASGLHVGDFITISGAPETSRKIIYIGGTTIQTEGTFTATVASGAVSFVAPSYDLVRPRELFLSAAPASQTWYVGDRVWNTAPASGSPMGWICTVSGTPGTFKTMPNLS